MPSSPPQLETARCIVRPAEPGDLGALVAAVRSPPFPRRLPLAKLAASGKLADWLDRMCSRSAEGSAFLWSIDLKEGARCIGQVSLSARPHSELWAVAFWFDPTQWGRGYAFEAVSGVIDAAFASLSIPELWAGAALWNRRSCKVLERLGFHVLAENVSGDRVSGEPEPIREFHLTLVQWQSRRNLPRGV